MPVRSSLSLLRSVRVLALACAAAGLAPLAAQAQGQTPRPDPSVGMPAVAAVGRPVAPGERAVLQPAQLRRLDVPGTTPMGAAAVDLVAAGYTEREFVASGQARRYRGVLPGGQRTGEIIDGGWPWRTRVLVRTPQPSNFNGTLVVEWTNVTAGQDIDFAFAESWAHLLREGYAVAVVSAQRVGVERLKTWSPRRYGDLDVSADATDPAGGAPIDACPPGAACPGDPLSWDIMTQVSMALKANARPVRPLPGLKVRQVIAMGESQSAMRLSLYYNAIQPIYRFFDGFVFLDQAQQMRDDVGTPAISVNSEVLADWQRPVTTGATTRVWEVAGTSHASFDAVQVVDRMLLRDRSVVGPQGPLGFTQMVGQLDCARRPMFSKVHTGLVLDAAIDGVRRWAMTGRPAAASRQFQRDAQGRVQRDADGRVIGGVRLAQYLAPTAESGDNSSPSGAIGCLLSGHHRDFTAEELKQRYGSHAAYVAQVRAAMTQAQRDGLVVARDAQDAIRAAEQSDVAR